VSRHVKPRDNDAPEVGDTQIILRLNILYRESLECIDLQGLVIIGDGLFQVVPLLPVDALRISVGQVNLSLGIFHRKNIESENNCRPARKINSLFQVVASIASDAPEISRSQYLQCLSMLKWQV
jgi:hypothetical protein